MTAKAVFSGILPNTKLQKPALPTFPWFPCMSGQQGRANSNQGGSYLDPTGLTLGITGGSWDVGWQFWLSC